MYNKEYFKKYYQENKEKINKRNNEYKKQYDLKNKEKKKEYAKQYDLKNQEKLKEKRKIYKFNKRIIVYNHYCNGDARCQRCGETNIKCLSIDHINSGGRKHRKEINNRSLPIWLIQNCFPKGFQILCMNCQFIKRVEEKECGGSGKRAYKYRLNQKMEVYNHYCNGDIKCKKCGMTDIRCLSIDHIDGGGRKHRKELKNNFLPKWIIDNNFPEGFQVLCMNCQFKKRVENNECCAIDAIRK